MKIGFYAGSFDPFTIGHLNIVKKACKLFDKVIIGLAVNPNKKGRFDKNEMKVAIEKTIKEEKINNAECIIFEDLTVDKAKEYNADFLIRGIRNSFDYSQEENLAEINEELSSLDTIYLRAGKMGAVSSSMVYELLKRDKDVSKYLPKFVHQLVTKKSS